MENADLVPIDEYRVFNKRTREQKFVSLQHEVDWTKKCLDNSVEDRKLYDKFGIAGKIGFVYMGIRAMCHLAGIGPELNPNEENLLDAIGFSLAYLGGACWASAKLIQYTDERSCRKDYQKVLGKLEQEKTA
ncbi:MAG: hypothetical protein Q8P57_04055 [Candidatus Pacearchaeota archaeon]|nr:hypothetical protein [Candidatus Pacearchaeota archaeon]